MLLNFLSNKDVIIVGDFNIPSFVLDESEPKLNILKNFIEVSDLKQYNNVKNTNGRLLDLVLSNITCQAQRDSSSLVKEDRHHPSLILQFSVTAQKSYNFRSNRDHRMFNFRKANFPLMYHLVSQMSWHNVIECTDVNDAVQQLERNLKNIFELSVPYKISSPRKYPPWFSRNTIKELKQKELAHRLYKKHKTDDYYDRFHNLRSSVKRKINDDYYNFLNHAENSISSDPTQFWNFIRNKKGNSRIPGVMRMEGSVFENEQDIVDAFGRYFSTSICDDPILNKTVSYKTINLLSHLALWKNYLYEDENCWTGVFADRLWILKQENNHIFYKVYEKNGEGKDESLYSRLLSNYFQLDTRLEEHYRSWSQVDPYFQEAAKQFYGIRILKQDVTENIFSFICSSNNHISRISSMVEKLAKFYGEEICEFDGNTYYTFPKVELLAGELVEEHLKNNGFGYRAKYISKSAQMIVENGSNQWLNELKEMSYAIPVDTHIYQIAKKFYLPKLANNKTVTEKIYNEIGDHFRKLYGPLAGWAHTVLFCADLKKFQDDTKTGKKENDVERPKKKLKN
ncbi:unnamed protein product [Callosobruchus maculatus]|uniref:N-glycosylase/DNA lyase n=1 Tax=Callosobruchus maculatus TaxID=64391 RepID=A0A653BI76_CALMS|nr:unnamed protein product [Callosobruchus maculatus]